METTNQFWRKGEPWVWVSSAALMAIMAIMATLLVVVIVNGFHVFWPARVVLAELDDGRRLMGEVMRVEPVPGSAGETRLQLKIGNRDLYGLDFIWIDRARIRALTRPADALVVERQEHGAFIGFLKTVRTGETAQPGSTAPLDAALRATRDRQRPVTEIEDQINAFNARAERLRLRLLRERYVAGRETPGTRQLEKEIEVLNRQVTALAVDRESCVARWRQDLVVVVDAAGTEKEIVLADVVRYRFSNTMGWAARVSCYGAKIREFLFDAPRESNTEGGIFPAIFGTVLMVFLMSILSFPLGIVGGVYLREYAREGILVRLVRVAVNNLAGVPSIVFGVFGLGFFIYAVGGSIDALFFPERLPEPTFGTGGILWASLTLGLLTVPVVIVATEEALGAIPMGIREASFALGSTKFQILTRLLLPMASPGILTGFILAMARAAGEVAPLMITGVVKMAPSLPFDGTPPFFHLERKFMHLGFHIYDIGFQCPNVEAAKPMVYVTALLLVLIVLALCSTAIHLRNKMKRRYTVKSL